MRGCCSCRELHPELSETKIRLDGTAVVASLVGSSLATLGGNVAQCGANGGFTASIWGFVYSMMEQEGMTKEEALSRRALEAFEDYGDNLLAVTQETTFDCGPGRLLLFHLIVHCPLAVILYALSLIFTCSSRQPEKWLCQCMSAWADGPRVSGCHLASSEAAFDCGPHRLQPSCTPCKLALPCNFRRSMNALLQ